MRTFCVQTLEYAKLLVERLHVNLLELSIAIEYRTGLLIPFNLPSVKQTFTSRTLIDYITAKLS